MAVKKEDGRWYKPCPNCGEEQSYLRKNYAELSEKLKKFCKSCSNKLTENCHRGFYEDIRLSWFTKAQVGAETRGLVWELQISDVWDLYQKQHGKCALSGLDIGWSETGTTHTASLDRIDSSQGYTLHNVQLVHKDVNMIKNAFDQDYFIDLCIQIAENNAS